MLLKPNFLLRFILVFQVALCSQWSTAAPIQLGGFFSTGITDANTDNLVLNAKQIENKTNYLADTVFGLQLDTLLSNEARFSAQLIAKDENNSFDLEAEWLFISYQITNDTQLRAGRLRIPLFLTSETILVGQSYNWVRPPLELYTLDSGLSQYNGFSVVHQMILGDASFEAEFYMGQTVGEINILGLDANFSSDELYGFQLSYRANSITVRVSRSEFDATVTVPAIPLVQSTKASFSVLGLDYDHNDWGAISEVGRIKTEGIGETTAYYVTLYYNLNRLMPLITYGSGKTASNSTSYKGESFTIGVKYHFNETTSFKAQVLKGEMLDGRSLLLGSAAPGFDDELRMYSMSLNLIF